MMNPKNSVALSLVLFSVATLFASATRAQDVAQIGQPAPDFELLDETGRSHRLSDYLGQIIVLEWTNPDCPFVVRGYESGTIPRTRVALATHDVAWFAIDSTDVNTAETSRAFRAEHRFSHPTLQDHDGQTGRRYGARTTPHIFVIDREGLLQYSGALDNNPRGNEPNPTNYVLQVVRALHDGEAAPLSHSTPYGCSVKYAD